MREDTDNNTQKQPLTREEKEELIKRIVMTLLACVVIAAVLVPVTLHSDWLRPGLTRKTESQNVGWESILSDVQKETLREAVVKLGGEGSDEDIRTIEAAMRDSLKEDTDAISITGVESAADSEGAALVVSFSAGQENGAVRIRLTNGELQVEVPERGYGNG